jgi:hypothetical protein
LYALILHAGNGTQHFTLKVLLLSVERPRALKMLETKTTENARLKTCLSTNEAESGGKGRKGAEGSVRIRARDEIRDMEMKGNIESRKDNEKAASEARTVACAPNERNNDGFARFSFLHPMESLVSLRISRSKLCTIDSHIVVGADSWN